VDNTSPHHGGVYAAGGTVVNTIIAGNESTVAAETDPAATAWGVGAGVDAALFAHCLMDVAPPVGAAWKTAQPAAVFENFGTGDYRLKPGSPAANAGIVFGHPPAVDLDGKPRVVGRIDLGCYEFPFLPGTLFIIK